MSAPNRLVHRGKIKIGRFLGFFLTKHFYRRHGLSRRIVSVFSESAARLGVTAECVIEPVPIKKAIPHFLQEGAAESRYRTLLLSGEDYTNKAGIFSAHNVDVSFPTGVHRIGGYILEEFLPAPYILINPKYYYGFASMRFRRKCHIEDGILVAMPRLHNFYHWLVEMLPRLILCDQVNLNHIPLIVPKSCPRFVSESLYLSGYGANTISLEDGVYRFSTLRMMSILAPTTEVSPIAVDWLNKKFAAVVTDIPQMKRIYISRSDAKIRFVSNETDLTPLLSQFGFEILTMSKLSLADQINIFRNADCIIGPHGAAFANLAFSKPGTTFIEFFSDGYYASCFNRIAASRDLRYGYVIGCPTGNGGYAVDPKSLRTILSHALR